jgi:hypothetical protein
MVKMRTIDDFALGIIFGVLMGILGNLWVSYWLVLYPPSGEIAPWLLIAASIALIYGSYIITKQRRTEVNNILKQGEILESLIGADIRTRDDKRGKIAIRKDGTYYVEWTVELKDAIAVSATPQVEVEKKKENRP